MHVHATRTYMHTHTHTHTHTYTTSHTYTHRYIDGKEFYRTQDAAMIPHTPAYLVLDNEVGLGHLAPSHPWAGDPTHTQFPQFMRVDHVRVWQQAGFTSATT